MAEQCELYDRECIDCGECDLCDLDSNKHCDDCGRCIEEPEEYRSITIEDFIRQNVTKDQLKRMEKKLLDRKAEIEDSHEDKKTGPVKKNLKKNMDNEKNSNL